jgi:hypothetical protein
MLMLRVVAILLLEINLSILLKNWGKIVLKDHLLKLYIDKEIPILLLLTDYFICIYFSKQKTDYDCFEDFCKSFNL